jgi:hypothetical protein
MLDARDVSVDNPSPAPLLPLPPPKKAPGGAKKTEILFDALSCWHHGKICVLKKYTYSDGLVPVDICKGLSCETVLLANYCALFEVF